MKIKESTWETCGSCGHRLRQLKEEEYGCDGCGAPIEPYSEDERSYLQLHILFHKQESQYRHYCSWNCCLADLAKVRTDYFICLPYLHYEDSRKGCGAKDFLKLIGPVSRLRKRGKREAHRH